MSVISFVFVSLSDGLRRRHQRADRTDLTFDSRMSSSCLIEDSFDPRSKPRQSRDKIGQTEAGEVVNRMGQPSALF